MASLKSSMLKFWQLSGIFPMTRTRTFLWVFIAFNPFFHPQLSFLSTSTIPLVPAWPLSQTVELPFLQQSSSWTLLILKLSLMTTKLSLLQLSNRQLHCHFHSLVLQTVQLSLPLLSLLFSLCLPALPTLLKVGKTRPPKRSSFILGLMLHQKSKRKTCL